MMITFWLILGFMTLIALAFVVWPLLRQPKSTQYKQYHYPTQRHANIQLYQQQLAQLEQALDNGDISPSVYKQLKTQTEVGLLEDAIVLPERRNLTRILTSLAFIKNMGRYSKQKPEKMEFNKKSINWRRDWNTAFILILLIPIFSGLLYWHWGDSRGLARYEYIQNHTQAFRSELAQLKNPQQVIAKLEALLAKEPHRSEGWFLLGRVQESLGHYQAAEQAFEQASQLKPKNIAYQLQYAQANFFANGKKLNQAGQRVLQNVLVAQPNNPIAINLVALNAFTQHNYRGAIANWEILLNVFPANTPDGKAILHAIQVAQHRLHGSGSETKNSSVISPEIKIYLNVSKILQKQYSPDTIVFVYVQTNVTPIPLAVRKIPLKSLPQTIILSDAQAMIPAQNLSFAVGKKLYVVARISPSGAAMPQTGDIEVRSHFFYLHKKSRIDLRLLLS